ncbi:type ISP restriction/modification enzyme [Spirulina sp. 06S082]|uniref:type ISP restriction/modification enzyme n=1 Tax=Spirulina sp. 06S082 TaxID=3110248 RepID=UPI002B1EC280|nr:type ISP restriction/modification enzyme [Spirulina sp. 06S082]MEA5471883.1 type ISP restriction/modification enzyme [Spirulina sp. 06S082]
MNLVATYLNDLSEIYQSGAGVKETSYYGCLENLLNAVGKTLKPKVRCIIQLKNRGAGFPDGGLFAANQFRKSSGEKPFEEIFPERGVMEIKGTNKEILDIAQSEQVDRYWQKYGQVLVTNYRDFFLIGRDRNGNKVTLERYILAEDEADFWQRAAHSGKYAEEKGDRFLEYLKRVLLQCAAITSPKNVAWFLASYARDAKSRLDYHADLPALTSIRQALEEALGIKFEGEKGDRFFRSTLIQTLFYGVFSAWVLWHKEEPDRQDEFNWQTAAYYLHVPMIQSLFYQLADPRKLKQMELDEVLNWTESALNRVQREAFFQQFEEGEAVQYFYEPFLEAFDPQLRKELGVWYTPPEIVKYMVERVDRVLREELEIEAGLADDNVYILDPCCGTGAYLVEVLQCIANSLQEMGMGALAIAKVKEAAIKRVFGFEILTAPFVVAHLQLGLVLQNLGVPLVEENERIGVYLTNALTGWQPPNEEKKKKFKQLELTFPELNQEREAADEVKRSKPILVILGNPPYNAFAGISPVEEDDLVKIYKEGLISDWGIKKFNLDDLYVRFFRLAERCISEQTGKGIVCYISNFSYLSDPSFVVMRQHFLEEFDRLWFDCLNGDSRETGKVTPEGKPDPSVFSTQYNKSGIRVGTAIALMVKKNKREKESLIRFKHFWGTTKNQDVLKSLQNQNFENSYEIVEPTKYNRYSFRFSDVDSYYLEWPKLTDLCTESPITGYKENRGFSLIDDNREILAARMEKYFDRDYSWEQLAALNTGLTRNAARFDAKKARKNAIAAEKYSRDRLMRYLLRPYELKWCYYSPVRPLWNEPRPSLFIHQFEGNSFLVSRPSGVAKPEGIPFYFINCLGDFDFIRGHSYHFPIRLKPLNIKNKTNQKEANQRKKQLQILDTEQYQDTTIKANLSVKARTYLTQLNLKNPDADIETAGLIWLHALAIGYSPEYLAENADGIRQDFPRIPLPNNQEMLYYSAQLGQKIAQLLDTEKNVIGVTTTPNTEYQQIAIISHTENQPLNPDRGDLAVTVDWGHSGKKGATMPGKGKVRERPYTEAEKSVIPSEIALQQLGNTTCDVYLNEIAYWQNVPINVWNYTIGGYQVMKKWLSYREEKLLNRPLKMAEIIAVTNMARRIASILLLQPQLNENYQQIKDSSYNWNKLTRSPSPGLL